MRRTTVVMLGEKDRVKDEKQQEREEEEKAKQQLAANQKVGVVEAMLRIGSWEHAQALLKRLPPFFAVSHAPVAETLTNLAHVLVEDLYKQ